MGIQKIFCCRKICNMILRSYLKDADSIILFIFLSKPGSFLISLIKPSFIALFVSWSRTVCHVFPSFLEAKSFRFSSEDVLFLRMAIGSFLFNLFEIFRYVTMHGGVMMEIFHFIYYIDTYSCCFVITLLCFVLRLNKNIRSIENYTKKTH